MRILNVQTPLPSSLVCKCFFNQMLAMHNEKIFDVWYSLKVKGFHHQNNNFKNYLEANHITIFIILSMKGSYVFYRYFLVKRFINVNFEIAIIIFIKILIILCSCKNNLKGSAQTFLVAVSQLRGIAVKQLKWEDDKFNYIT